MNRRGNIAALGLLTFCLLAGLFTFRAGNERQFDVFHDMRDSPAAAPQSPELFDALRRDGGRPEGRPVARGEDVFPYPATVEGRKEAGLNLQSPIEATTETLQSGRRVYQTYCAHCHGRRGLGDGPVAQRARLGMPLVGEATRRRRDGELFHILTHGRLLMPSFDHELSADERWRVIRYVRALQGGALPPPEPEPQGDEPGYVRDVKPGESFEFGPIGDPPPAPENSATTPTQEGGS